MSVKRSRYYNEVSGVTVDADGNVRQSSVIVDGRCRDERNAMKRAKREYDGEFIPTSARQFAIKYAMPDSVFFEYAEAEDGEEPREVGYGKAATDDSDIAE